MPDGSGTVFYYEGDPSDSDCGSVEDRERDTPPVVFGDQLFWDDDMAESSRVLPDGGYAAVLMSPILAGTIAPFRIRIERLGWTITGWKF